METNPDEVVLLETDVKSWSIRTAGSNIERYDTFGTLNLTEGSVIWKQADQRGREVTPIKIPLNDVVAVTSGDTKSNELVVHHVIREDGHRWIKGEVIFELVADLQCCQWQQKIVGKLKEPLYQRPKSLLVFINPKSGRETAESVYNREVAPLFKLAGVQVDVRVTQKQGDFQEIVDSYNLTTIDGIVTVGGDGTFNIVCGALMSRTAKEHDIDTSDPQLSLQKPALRVGMIAAGTGNEFVHYTTGVKDPVTSALRIIVGNDISIDVCTLHQNNKPLSLCTLLMVGYGFYGDVGALIEQNRHLGFLRVFYAFGKTLYHHRVFKAEVEYLPASDKECGEDKSNDWVKIEGEFQTSCCWCHGLPVGADSLLRGSHVTSNAHNRGRFGFTLVRKCSRWQELKHMGKIFRRNRPTDQPTAFDMDYVTAVQATECRIRIIPEGDDEFAYSLNIDGEIANLEDPPSYHIKIHPQRLRIFAQGVDDIN